MTDTPRDPLAAAIEKYADDLCASGAETREAVIRTIVRAARPSADEGLREAAPAIIRVFDAMSRYDTGLVTLPHVRGVAGIGNTFLTEEEFKALARLVDAARAALAATDPAVSR